MLRTNLSTRPFYNVRAVRALLGLFALVVVGFTLFNVVAADPPVGARSAR